MIQFLLLFVCVSAFSKEPLRYEVNAVKEKLASFGVDADDIQMEQTLREELASSVDWFSCEETITHYQAKIKKSDGRTFNCKVIMTDSLSSPGFKFNVDFPNCPELRTKQISKILRKEGKGIQDIQLSQSTRSEIAGRVDTMGSQLLSSRPARFEHYELIGKRANGTPVRCEVVYKHAKVDPEVTLKNCRK